MHSCSDTLMSAYPSRYRTFFADELAIWVIGGLIALMPLALGAYQTWALFVVMLGCSVLGACLLWRWIRRDRTGGLVWSVAYLPLAGFLLLILLQLLPLPPALLAFLSPQASLLYRQAFDGAATAAPLSIYPHATWHDLLIVVIAAMLFLATLNIVRRSSQLKRLLQIIAVTGCLLAALAIAQGLFGNRHFYWVGPEIVQPNSGTFGNHNHFSEHMNLSIMAMLAWAMIRLHETLGARWLRRGLSVDWFGIADLRLARWFVVFAVVGWLAVALSSSRMGMGSAVAGIATLAALTFARRRAGRTVMPVAVGLVALIVVIVVAGDAVYERMSTLHSLDSYADRWIIITDIMPAVRQYPVFGTGLGTFSAIYPSYATQLGHFTVTHAENDYVQTLCETGILGIAMVAAFLFILGRAAWRVCFLTDDPANLAAAALVAGLVTVAVHGWTNFGQHSPAVAGLSAIFCGLLLALDYRSRRGRDQVGEAHLEPWFTRLAPPVLVSLLLLLALLRMPPLFAEVLAEAYDQDATELAGQIRPDSSEATQTCARAMELAGRACDLDPDNAWYWYRLAVARWQASTAGQGMPQVSDPVPDTLRVAVAAVVADLARASACSPAMGASYCFRGQLEWWVLGDEKGRQRIEHSMRAAGNSALSWMVGARIAAELGHDEVARQRARQAVQLSRGYFPQAANLVAGYMQHPEASIELAGSDPELLYDLSLILEKLPAHDAALAAREQAIAAYAGRIDDHATPAWALAMLAQDAVRQGDDSRAATLYQLALAKRYMFTPWRLAHARCLIRSGQVSSALLELDTAERMGARQKDIDALRRQAYAAQDSTSQPAASQP